MKVGTVPKITVGAAALIAVIFIGFIGSPNECAHSRRAGVSVAVGGWDCTPTKQP